LTGSRTNRGKQAKEVDITVKFKKAIFKSENSSKKIISIRLFLTKPEYVFYWLNIVAVE
jgi:hypothetical protein